MNRLSEARRSLIDYRERLQAAMSERESEIKLRCENHEVILAPRRRLIQDNLTSMKSELNELQRILKETPIIRKLGFRFRKTSEDAQKLREKIIRYENEMPLLLAKASAAAKEEASDNVYRNGKKRRVLGSLPSLIDKTNATLEALAAGDAAVATCLIRGQTERALRVGSIWKARKQNREILPADTDFYLTAFYERDTPYEQEDKAAQEAETFIRRQKLIENGMQVLRISEIMKALSENRNSGTIIDAEWEDMGKEDNRRKTEEIKLLRHYDVHDNQP